jgi:hypothetical protein
VSLCVGWWYGSGLDLSLGMVVGFCFEVSVLSLFLGVEGAKIPISFIKIGVNTIGLEI